MPLAYRIGLGEDAHALAEGRLLVIGGVEIPSPWGSVAHSDGDVLLHALADALLSTFALGDIGSYFPPSDPAFRNLDSRTIVREVLARLEEQAGPVTLHNIAGVVTLDEPRLGHFRERMQGEMSDLLSLHPTQVGLGFKTSEGLAPRHVQARVTVLLSTDTA